METTLIKNTIDLPVFNSLEELNSKGIKFLDKTEEYELLTKKLGIFPLMSLIEGNIELRKYLTESINTLQTYLESYNIELTIDETSFFLKYLIAWYRHSVGTILRSDIESYFALIPSSYPSTIEETYLRIMLMLDTVNIDNKQISDLLEMDFEVFLDLISNILNVRNSIKDVEP